MVFVKPDALGPVLYHLDLTIVAVVGTYLDGGDDDNISVVPRGTVGFEEPEDADLAGPEVHQRGARRGPLPGRFELLPHPAHHRRALGGGGGEVDGAERAVPGRVPERALHGQEPKRQPVAAPWDVLRFSQERQRPVAFLSPRAFVKES